MPNTTLQLLSFRITLLRCGGSLLLGLRNFFDNQTRHWLPSRIAIGASITRTVSNVDANADTPFSDVVTVALYCSVSVVVRASTGYPQHCVNRQRSPTLGAIESDKPSLTTATAASQIDISLEDNMKSCIVLNLCKIAILKTQHYIVSDQSHTGHYEMYWFSLLFMCSVAILLDDVFAISVIIKEVSVLAEADDTYLDLFQILVIISTTAASALYAANCSLGLCVALWIYWFI